MKIKSLGMCRGDGKAYVGVRLPAVPAGTKPVVEARTDAGREIPVLWHQDGESEKRFNQACGVLVFPLLSVESVTFTLSVADGSGGSLDSPSNSAPKNILTNATTRTMKLNMNVLKWTSRLMYRLRPQACKKLLAIEAACTTSAELLVCVPDESWTVWRLAITRPFQEELKGQEKNNDLEFSLLDAQGNLCESEPLILENQVVDAPSARMQKTTVSFRLLDSSRLECFCIAVADSSNKTIAFFGLGPGEREGALAQTHLRQKNASNQTDYQRWRAAHTPTQEELKLQTTTNFAHEPLISIVTPSFQPNLRYLAEMITSVCAQTYGKWELILVDAQPQESGVAKVLPPFNDERIKRIDCAQNLGIVGNTNYGIKQAAGDFIAFLDYDDVLAPQTLFEYVKAINENPHAGLLYCDEEMFEQSKRKQGKQENESFSPIFKSPFNRDLLYTHNCVTHFLMVSRQALEEVGLSDNEVNGAQDYDLTLKILETNYEIIHVPHMLYRWRMHADSTSGDNAESKPYAHEAGRLALKRHFERRNLAVHVEDGKIPYTYRVRYTLPSPHPLVDIIIPSKDYREILDACLTSILELSTYDNYAITVIENNSTDEATFCYYEEIQQRSDKVKVLFWEGEFNYSQLINFGMSKTAAPYALLLNNDTEVISPDFIEEMLGYLQRPEVGVVGAKLYFSDRLVQHAGMLIGPHDMVVHVNQNLARDGAGYLSRAERPGSFSSVTGACQMVKRSVFEHVGGYTEAFAVGFNDADFCCKVTEAGYLVVFSPYAELFHHEFTSRGREEGDSAKMQRWQQERELMIAKWSSYFTSGDPFLNPNLDRNSCYFALPE